MSEDNVEINAQSLSSEDAEYDEDDEQLSGGSLLALNKIQKPAAEVNEESIVINTEEGTVVDVTKLSPLEKIRLVEAKFGLKIDEPDPSCKKCHGRGYTGIFANGTPEACLCLHRTYKKENPKLWEHILGARNNSSWNRKMFRSVKNLKTGPTNKTKNDIARRYGKVMDVISRTDTYKKEKEIVEQAKLLREQLIKEYTESEELNTLENIVEETNDSLVEAVEVVTDDKTVEVE